MTIHFLDIFFQSCLLLFLCVNPGRHTDLHFSFVYVGFLFLLLSFQLLCFFFVSCIFFSLHFFIAIKSFLSYHSLTNTIVTQSPHVTKMDSLFVKRFVNFVRPLSTRNLNFFFVLFRFRHFYMMLMSSLFTVVTK